MSSPTTPPPAHSASQHVFDVYELLEQILVGVDMKTLLHSQRVDQSWNALIANSKKLQQKLFMLPATKQELSMLNVVEMQHYEGLGKQRIWHNVWNLTDHYDNERCIRRPRTDPDLVSDVVVFNPLLMHPHHRQLGFHEDYASWGMRAPNFKQVSKYGPSDREADLITKNHPEKWAGNTEEQHVQPGTPVSYSWQKMLLVQPTPQHFELTLSYQNLPVAKSKINGSLHLGDFICAAEKYASTQATASQIHSVLSTCTGPTKLWGPGPKVSAVLFSRDGKHKNFDIRLTGEDAKDEDVEEFGYSVTEQDHRDGGRRGGF